MAETFGVVSGAISIAALFNDCVDCFEYIQFARHFGKDYSRCQLRLDVAKWRLDRWGAAIDINNDPRFRSGAAADDSVGQAQDILREIVGSIEGAYKVSRRYERTTPKQDRVALTTADLDPSSQRLRNEFQAITQKRQNRTSLIKKTRWALYDKNQLGNLINNIVSFIDELEQVFPTVDQLSTQLARMEIQEVDDQESLNLIQDGAIGPDPVLSELAKQKLAGVDVHNSATRIKTFESAKFAVGNIFTDEATGKSVGFPYSATNHVEDIEVGRNSGVHVGDTYGGKGFWDD